MHLSSTSFPVYTPPASPEIAHSAVGIPDSVTQASLGPGLNFALAIQKLDKLKTETLDLCRAEQTDTKAHCGGDLKPYQASVDNCTCHFLTV